MSWLNTPCWINQCSAACLKSLEMVWVLCRPAQHLVLVLRPSGVIVDRIYNPLSLTRLFWKNNLTHTVPLQWEVFLSFMTVCISICWQLSVGNTSLQQCHSYLGSLMFEGKVAKDRKRKTVSSLICFYMTGIKWCAFMVCAFYVYTLILF